MWPWFERLGAIKILKPSKKHMIAASLSVLPSVSMGV